MPPINKKQVRSFIGLLKYYRNMWAKRSHLLQLLTLLASKKVKFKWTPVEQNVFNEVKVLVTLDTLLIYPDFNKKLISIWMLANSS